MKGSMMKGKNARLGVVQALSTAGTVMDEGKEVLEEEEEEEGKQEEQGLPQG